MGTIVSTGKANSSQINSSRGQNEADQNVSRIAQESVLSSDMYSEASEGLNSSYTTQIKMKNEKSTQPEKKMSFFRRMSLIFTPKSDKKDQKSKDRLTRNTSKGNTSVASNKTDTNTFKIESSSSRENRKKKPLRQRSKTLPPHGSHDSSGFGKDFDETSSDFSIESENPLLLENTTKYSHLTSSGRDEDGNMMINNYTLLHTIGSGGYGKVKLATDPSNRAYAIKIINKSLLSRIKQQGGGNALQNVQREIAILKRLRHPNIVRLFEVIDDEENGKLFLVMEAIENGPIVTMNDDGSTSVVLEESQARHYMFDIVHGLEYLHSQGVVHHDIKPENLLVDSNDNVKVTDFGVSHEVGHEDQSNSRKSYTGGTPAFSPPEISDITIPFDGKIADIWSLGVTLYVIVFGQLPFEGETIIEILQNIKEKPVILPDFPSISPQLQDLILKMLIKDPRKRITIEEIKKHPWMEGEYFIKQVPDSSKINATARNVTSNDVQNAIQEGTLKAAEKVIMIVNIKNRIGKVADRIRQKNAEKRSLSALGNASLTSNGQDTSMMDKDSITGERDLDSDSQYESAKDQDSPSQKERISFLKELSNHETSTPPKRSIADIVFKTNIELNKNT